MRALLLIAFAGIAICSSAQKTEKLTLTGSYSASNGGFHFSNEKGDTIFYCPTHPDSCLEKGRTVSLYPDSTGGPDLLPRFSNKKFMVTYTITDPEMDDNGDGPGVTATVTKMVLMK